jgi:hypothetical protein
MILKCENSTDSWGGGSLNNMNFAKEKKNGFKGTDFRLYQTSVIEEPPYFPWEKL